MICDFFTNSTMGFITIKQGCRFVPEKHFQKQAATDGTKPDLNIGETRVWRLDRQIYNHGVNQPKCHLFEEVVHFFGDIRKKHGLFHLDFFRFSPYFSLQPPKKIGWRNSAW